MGFHSGVLNFLREVGAITVSKDEVNQYVDKVRENKVSRRKKRQAEQRKKKKQ